jgi:hypothetical protein
MGTGGGSRGDPYLLLHARGSMGQSMGHQAPGSQLVSVPVALQRSLHSHTPLPHPGQFARWWWWWGGGEGEGNGRGGREQGEPSPLGCWLRTRHQALTR